jgi:hypothetical protein
MGNCKKGTAKMEKDYAGIEKREHTRRFFTSDDRPTIRIGIQEFDVIDISERGVRFVNDKKVTQKGWVNGCIVFPGKVPIDVDGVIVRDEDGDMGLHLVAPIDPYPS